MIWFTRFLQPGAYSVQAASRGLGDLGDKLKQRFCELDFDQAGRVAENHVLSTRLHYCLSWLTILRQGFSAFTTVIIPLI
jgi:hypothetical protein